HAQPAGAVEVVLAVPVPVKLDFDAAELVRKDLFARGTDHHRRLRSLDDGARSQAERPERQCHRNARESVAVAKLTGLSREEIPPPGRQVTDARDHVLAVRVEVTGQRELVPGDHLAATAGAGDDEARKGVLLHADLDRAPVVLEDLLELRGLLPSPFV